METRPAPAANRSYEDFEPVSKWRREEGRDIIELHLPGFRREHIRVQLNHLGFMVISGERTLDGTRWRRFKKEIELPKYCNVDAIHANFTLSILSVVMPKKIPLIHAKEEERQIPEIGREKEKEKDQNMEFGGRGTAEETETNAKEALAEDTHHDTDAADEDEFEENGVALTPETTREIALKFMVMVIVILVVASYVADKCKSFIAQAQSYFHN